MRYLIVSLVLTAFILSGCKQPPTPVQAPPPAPRAEAPKPADVAAESWQKLVADARAECEKNPGCTLDYEKMHEHDGRFFGVTVIGYKDSEYYVDLFRFDPKTDKWTDSPHTMTETGLEGIDYPTTSKQWNVPEKMLQTWIALADRTVKEIYSKRQ